jgi:hypothetical protein
VTILTDPSLEAYKAMDLRRGLGSTFRPSIIKHGIRAWKSGHKQGRTQGDAMQLGGVFVIDASGTIGFSQRSTEAGDHASINDVLAALQH